MASTYLSKSITSTGNQQKLTFSAWVKRTGTGTGVLFTTGVGSARSMILIESGGNFQFSRYNGGYIWHLNTTRKLRDCNAWYHIVCAFDTTQSTASDRVKIYINGVQETSFGTETYPSLNYIDNFNLAGQTQYLGQDSDGNFDFDGCMSHVHYIDGTAYAPTEFGETDATTGEWKINTSPSVTYGTNGFFILKDGNSVTDQSGNSNNFTVGGGTLTKTEDSPSNVFATLNPLSPQSYTFSNGNNTIARAGGTGQTTAIGTLAVNSGKWYWELKLNSGISDYPRVGIYEMNSDNHIYTTHLGNASNGTGKWWGSGGASSSNKKIGDGNSSTIEFYPYDNGDILMFALDCDNEKVWFGKNGTWYTNNNSTTTTGTAISNNTATPAFSNVSNSKLWIPAVFGNAGADNWSINFGNGYFGTTAVSSAGTNASGIGIFEFDVPANFTALSTKGLNL